MYKWTPERERINCEHNMMLLCAKTQFPLASRQKAGVSINDEGNWFRGRINFLFYLWDAPPHTPNTHLCRGDDNNWEFEYFPIWKFREQILEIHCKVKSARFVYKFIDFMARHEVQTSMYMLKPYLSKPSTINYAHAVDWRFHTLLRDLFHLKTSTWSIKSMIFFLRNWKVSFTSILINFPSIFSFFLFLFMIAWKSPLDFFVK